MKKIVLIILIFVSFISCKKNEDELVLPTEIINNTATVTNANDNFSYSINATKYTKDESYNLNFTSDSVKVSLAASNLTTGSVKIEIVLKDGTKPFFRNLFTNYSLSEQFKVKSDISKINISFTNYTGNLSINIRTAY